MRGSRVAATNYVLGEKKWRVRRHGVVINATNDWTRSEHVNVISVLLQRVDQLGMSVFGGAKLMSKSDIGVELSALRQVFSAPMKSTK
jgi:hypothetical protein